MSENNTQNPKILRRILDFTLTTLKLWPKIDGTSVSVTTKTTDKLSHTSSKVKPSKTTKKLSGTNSKVKPSNQGSRNKAPKIKGTAASSTSRATKEFSRTISKVEPSYQGFNWQNNDRSTSYINWQNNDTSTSYIYAPSSSSFSTYDDDHHHNYHSYFPPLMDHKDHDLYNIQPLMRRSGADPYFRPLIDYRDQIIYTSDDDDDVHDHDHYRDLYDDDVHDHNDYHDLYDDLDDDQYFPPNMDYDDLYVPPLMQRNDADDPYVRPVIDYGDQIFHKYNDDDNDDDEDDDEQYFTPRSSTDHKDFDDLDVLPLMKRNDAGDPYIRPLVISDDQKYAEQLQLEEALVFSSTSIASTSPTIKLPIDSSELPKRYCNICMDTKIDSEMFRNTNVCVHMFCFDCIREHVAVKIKENMVNVRCPNPSCKGIIRPEVCRFFVPREVLIRWERALCESIILGSHKFYCPFKDCSALLVDDGRQRVTSSECPNCNRLFCAQCKVAWHAGMDCRQFQMVRKGEIDPTDILLMNLAKTKNWKRCPKCSFYVEKTQGCLHISCRCGYEFCYGCGMKYNNLHGVNYILY